MAQLSIALYDRGLAGSYHWALILSQGIPSDPVDIYQITDTVEGQPAVQGPWRLDHRLGGDLRGSRRFIGCILLRIVDKQATVEILREFIADYGAAKPEHYRTENNVPWSCARWIIRIIEDFAQAETVEVEMEGFYGRVLARGIQLKGGQGDKSSGVQTIEL